MPSKEAKTKKVAKPHPSKGKPRASDFGDGKSAWIHVRCRPDHLETFQKLGGSAWLRSVLDSKRED